MFIFEMYKRLFTILGFHPAMVTKYGETKEDIDTTNYIMRHLLGFISLALILGFFIHGSINANNPNKCKIRKISDFVITAPYAIGCNLFKDRFDLKLN